MIVTSPHTAPTAPGLPEGSIPIVTFNLKETITQHVTPEDFGRLLVERVRKNPQLQLDEQNWLEDLAQIRQTKLEAARKRGDELEIARLERLLGE